MSLAPLSYKKVEHRDEILHYKSTTQSQERMIPMLNQDYTAKVLNLEDVIITNVENISDVLHICLELPRQKHRCPACGALTDRIHDYRMQTIKDIPMGRETLLHLRKRRYRCSCGKRFFEKTLFSLATTVLPADLSLQLLPRSVIRFLLPGSERNIMYPAQLPCATSSALVSGLRSSRGSFFGRVQGQLWRSEV